MVRPQEDRDDDLEHDLARHGEHMGLGERMKKITGWRIVDEYSGEPWIEPGNVLPKTFPSRLSAWQFLNNQRWRVMGDRTQGHKPQPLIQPIIEDTDTIQAWRRKLVGRRLIA
jgi:hypothetical protein